MPGSRARPKGLQAFCGHFKAVAFPEDVHQVEVTVVGSSRIITPVGKRWDDLFAGGPRASEDFMPERVQPPAGEREPLGGTKTRGNGRSALRPSTSSG